MKNNLGEITIILLISTERNRVEMNPQVALRPKLKQTYRVAHLLRENIMLTAFRQLRLGGLREHLYVTFHFVIMSKMMTKKIYNNI